MDTKTGAESQYEDVEMASKTENSTNLPPALATLTSAEAIRVEKKVVRKQDMVMMPLLAGCTFFVFLVRVSNIISICIARLTCDKDRAALGNSRLMKFPQDLHLTNQQFYNCLMIICTWSISVRATCSPSQMSAIWPSSYLQLSVSECGIRILSMEVPSSSSVSAPS